MSHSIVMAKFMKVYCENCVSYYPDASIGLEPCKMHPYCNRNKHGNCKDYKRKWYKFLIK
jgi:hypothetical protein